MSNKENDVYFENLVETVIEDSIDELQEIHAKGYMGIDDDMSDDFDNWLSNLTYDDLVAYKLIKK